MIFYKKSHDCVLILQKKTTLREKDGLLRVANIVLDYFLFLSINDVSEPSAPSRLLASNGK